jgi:hypothetical protein
LNDSLETDAAYHERPAVTLERLARLERIIQSDIADLTSILKQGK